MSDRPSRLRQARLNAGFKSARSASVRFGWRPSTYAAHENGQNDFDDEIAVRYAKAFRVEPGWLFMGYEHQESEYQYVFPIDGYVRNGEVIFAEKVGKLKVNNAALPFKVSSKSTMFAITDNGQWPRYIDGELLIASLLDVGPLGFLEAYCVVELEDGRTMVSGVTPVNGTDCVDLFMFNRPLIRNVRLKRAWIIDAVIANLGWQILREGKHDLFQGSVSRLLEPDKEHE